MGLTIITATPTQLRDRATQTAPPIEGSDFSWKGWPGGALCKDTNSHRAMANFGWL